MTNLENEINEYFLKQEEDSKQIKIKNNYNYTFIYINENYIVDIYSNDNTHIMRATYEILGNYNIISSIWIWAWAISYIEKKLTIASKNILKYSKILEDKVNDKEIERYLYYTKNPTFYISFKNLDELIKLSFFITKGFKIIPRKINNNIEFILIKQILQEK
jgi:hypothetical protein